MFIELFKISGSICGGICMYNLTTKQNINNFKNVMLKYDKVKEYKNKFDKSFKYTNEKEELFFKSFSTLCGMYAGYHFFPLTMAAIIVRYI